MSIGVPYNVFWSITLTRLNAFVKADEMKQVRLDSQMWQMGNYVLSAVATAIDRGLNGRKAKSKYAKEPMLKKVYADMQLTEEERNERDLKLLIAEQERWIASLKQGGLKTQKKDK